jgi:hypothetical protein
MESGLEATAMDGDCLSISAFSGSSNDGRRH